jgi:hypothetical protein
VISWIPPKSAGRPAWFTRIAISEVCAQWPHTSLPHARGLLLRGMLPGNGRVGHDAVKVKLAW